MGAAVYGDTSSQDQYESPISRKEILEREKTDCGAREPAWEVLEAQSPDNLECYHCRRYHLLTDINKFALSEDKPYALMPCRRIDKKHRTTKFIHPGFHFTVFRMIMKQFRQNRNCSELLKLLSYRSGVLIDGSQVKRIIATPNIIAGRLLMRVQTAYVVPPTPESRLNLANKNHLKCPHSHRWTPSNKNLARKLLDKFEVLETLSEGYRESLLSIECTICLTRFQVALQRFEREGTMLFITKWQDLGTGLSPLESDMRSIVGPWQDIPKNGLGQRLIAEPLEFDGNGLDPSSSLTVGEREEQFGRSESKELKTKRAKETFYWKYWGRGFYFPHEFAKEDI